MDSEWEMDENEKQHSRLEIGLENNMLKIKRLGKLPKPSILIGGPNGVRTRVTGVRGRCPRPLDDGTIKEKIQNPGVRIQNKIF